MLLVCLKNCPNDPITDSGATVSGYETTGDDRSWMIQVSSAVGVEQTWEYR